MGKSKKSEVLWGVFKGKNGSNEKGAQKESEYENMDVGGDQARAGEAAKGKLTVWQEGQSKKWQPSLRA